MLAVFIVEFNPVYFVYLFAGFKQAVRFKQFGFTFL